jgi:hypothetical protein
MMNSILRRQYQKHQHYQNLLYRLSASNSISCTVTSVSYNSSTSTQSIHSDRGWYSYSHQYHRQSLSLSTSAYSNHDSFTTKPVPIEDLNDRHSYSHKIETEEQYENIQQMNLSKALKPYYDNQTPVLIRNFYNSDNKANNRAAAMTKWKDLDYLQNTIGQYTTCFVEIGGSYNTNTNQRPEIDFGDYISYMKLFHDQYGSTGSDDDDDGIGGGGDIGDDGNTSEKNKPQNEEIVYMAQNSLDSFPIQIKDDFILPKLCYYNSGKDMNKDMNDDENIDIAAFSAIGNGQLYNTMFWFGPKHCISPLHYDPLDNLLMGFVGRKKIILFPKDDDDDNNNSIDSNDAGMDMNMSTWHYAGTNGQQYNTSPIDINERKSDIFTQYPNFEKAPTGMECILHPGDVLFIPQRWWHHVTSLDTAVSVNVWWR